MRKATGVVAAVSATALVLGACASPDSQDQAAETVTETATETATESEAPTGADAVEPIDVSDCQPADGVTGHIEGGEAEGETSDRDIDVAPEVGSGYRAGMQAVNAENFAVATANPLATAAACDVLLNGGNAADAVVTAQFMLGLVEPQSSGLGGGGYILYYDNESGETVAIDGREVAPLAADENYLTQVSARDDSEVKPDARASGRSIGVPGIVAALDELHQSYGQSEWEEILQPAADTATEGFEVSPRLSASIAGFEEELGASPNAAEYFLDDEGKALQPGHSLTNEDYAEVVEAIATEGVDAFYTGEIARAIVEEANREDENLTPSVMTTADMAGYTPVVHDVLCAPYRELEVCGMPPSSSGGSTVLEALRLLEGYDLEDMGPGEAGPDGALPSAEAVHLIAEAERLAYADRDAYIADPAFEDVPGGVEALLADGYIEQRAELINEGESMGEAEPGDLGELVSAGPQIDENGTTHISVIDGDGNAASATTSVEAAFGSFHFTKGMILNNQLTDFSADPVNEDGEPIANRVEAAKRPRSSMAPLLVFDREGAAGAADASATETASADASATETAAETSAAESEAESAAESGAAEPGAGVSGERGDLRMVIGSPGGAVIIQYVIKTLLQIADWGMNPQQAVSSPNFGARNEPETGIGGEHPAVADGEADELISELEGKGHTVETDEFSSGLSALVVTEDGIQGGADPRREGIVLGG